MHDEEPARILTPGFLFLSEEPRSKLRGIFHPYGRGIIQSFANPEASFGECANFGIHRPEI